jgi:hypothetical protein
MGARQALVLLQNRGLQIPDSPVSGPNGLGPGNLLYSQKALSDVPGWSQLSRSYGMDTRRAPICLSSSV